MRAAATVNARTRQAVWDTRVPTIPIVQAVKAAAVTNVGTVLIVLGFPVRVPMTATNGSFAVTDRVQSKVNVLLLRLHLLKQSVQHS